MALCAEVNKTWMLTSTDAHYKVSQVAHIVKNPPANAVDPWVVNKAEIDVFLDSLAFSMIQWMLAI